MQFACNHLNVFLIYEFKFMLFKGHRVKNVCFEVCLKTIMKKKSLIREKFITYIVIIYACDPGPQNFTFFYDALRARE